VALKLHPLLLDPAQPLERKHLEAAGVGQHGPFPGGEPVETPHCLDHFFAGTKMQVVGISQNDLRAGPPHVSGTEPSNHRVGAHRHEGGRVDLAVGQREPSRPSEPRGSLEAELEHGR
jgi:hypothetical protein